ncbi:hypothetical protein BpHYR1_027218 [Brachionus plicatilis]|uniref:Uncharacterized protein n=1 Tax=Brachionus plicatilis TaxID=10195 RepID=A0A3M7T811_BRAPC|nr:hypothetical protein BpHYR1_027218 [Brachionus plicatilis]
MLSFQHNDLTWLLMKTSFDRHSNLIQFRTNIEPAQTLPKKQYGSCPNKSINGSSQLKNCSPQTKNLLTHITTKHQKNNFYIFNQITVNNY